MASITTYIKEQVNTLLFFIRANRLSIPYFIMWINLISYCVLYKVVYDYFFNDIPIENHVYPDWYLYLESNVRHFFEYSGITLLMLLFDKFERYNWINRMSIICLFLLLSVNTIYLLIGMKADIYFCVTVCLIYFIFVTLAARKLTNR